MTSVDARDLAQQIARHLTGPARWSATGISDLDGVRQRSLARLTRDADGAAIHLCVGGWRNEGRVTFRGCWPMFHDGRQYAGDSLSITCNAERDPATLAREIERRLFVDYDPAYRAALDYVRASDAAAGEAARAAERIASAIGAELPRPESYRQQRNADAVELLGGPSSIYRLKVSAAYRDRPLSVSFEVSGVDEATALRILALLPARGQEGAR